MSDIVTELAALLGAARRPGDFCTSGTTLLLAPALSVDGVGPIALPVLPVQAAQLVAVAERAPYGRGPDTIVDTAVRSTWQIGPEHVRIGGRHWPSTLDAILAMVSEGLGVGDPIEAEFYKLLIYDQGSFFVSHRDTEKSPGMFATLVIALPSVCTGGALIVRHKDRSVSLDLRSGDPSEVAFAAFYADCLHEVLPVTEGCRLTLVYNLIRRGSNSVPKPPDYGREQEEVAALLRDWRARLAAGEEEVPQKLVYPLGHAYTAPEFGFGALKGVDAAAAGVLAAATRAADCALHLALVELEEHGSADYADDYDNRRHSHRPWDDDEEEGESEEGDDDDGDFQVGEIDDFAITLSDWHACDGPPVSWGKFPAEVEELSPPDPFHDLKPDELHFQEASGNAGVSFERRYRRAALVVWPNDRAMAVLTQAGPGVSAPHLRDLAERWVAEGAKPDSPIRQQAGSLAGHVIDQWSSDGGGFGDTESPATGLLQALTRLQDATHAGAFLKRVVAAACALERRDTAAIVAALRLFAAGEAVDLLERLVAGNAANRFTACADLLARTSGDEHVQPAALAEAAALLVGALPATRPAYSGGQGRNSIDGAFVADLLIGLGRIDAGLADQAVTWLLAHPTVYDADALLVPAVRDRLGHPDIAAQPAVARLRASCLAHLDARIALPLAPPADWVRPSAVGCSCSHCTQLSRFLADPRQGVWAFRAAAADRTHVEATIRAAQCDVDTGTDKRGRPYSLICTKNQASYQRRVAERRQDLADAEMLRAAV
jgi:hypothetical protein